MKVTNSFFLIGPMGAGKTTIARLLSSALNYEFIDSDHFLVDKTGVDIPLIFELEGEEGFRQREYETLDELTQKNNIVLATGGGAVVREENRRLLAQRGTVIYLNVSPEVQFSRIQYSKNRPLLHNKDPQTVLKNLYEYRHPLYQSIADYIVLSEHKSSKIVAEALVDLLYNRLVVDCDWIIKNT